MRYFWATMFSVVILTAAFLAAALCSPAYSADKPVDPSFAPPQDDPKLPRVLLIGDSISIGYTVPVRELLAGKANVHRPATNCGDSGNGARKVAEWTAGEKWDVIHFNFGLHDLKYLDAAGKYVTPDKGKQVNSLDQYEQNLRKIVEQLKATHARLIWCSTTPVPEGSAGRVQGDELKYNEVAARVMKELNVETDDLHAVVVAHPDIQLPKNVHFTKDGYQMLAKQVSESIEKALAKK